MDANGLSVRCHLRSKPVGKVKRRVQELRFNTYYYDPMVSSGRPALDLSHSETQRLAADALLNEGIAGYREVLTSEGEVDFLSEQEKSYILQNREERDVGYAERCSADGEEDDLQELCVGSLQELCVGSLQELCVGSLHDETAVPSWDPANQNGVPRSDGDSNQHSVEVFLQSDDREGSMKDAVRGFISKAQKALVIVVDTFSDVELLCDVLEASTKRNVSVCLLLDHLNLHLFQVMCQELNVDGEHFPKLWVRSVGGLSYCAKTGRKLSGQITEAFIISDWTRVLTGSYSFSWLSWQANRNFIIFLGGQSVSSFHHEFQRLCVSSRPVFPTVSKPSPFDQNVTQNGLFEFTRKRESPSKAGGNGPEDGRPVNVETVADVRPTSLILSKLEVDHNRAEHFARTLVRYQSQTPAPPDHLPQLHWKRDNVREAMVSQGPSDALPADSANLTICRTYKQKCAGINTQCVRGHSTLKTHVNPNVRAKPPAGAVAGLLYQELSSRGVRESAISVSLNALRGQRNDSKADPFNFDSQLLCTNVSQQAHPREDTRGLCMPTTCHRRWLPAQGASKNDTWMVQTAEPLKSHPRTWRGVTSQDMKLSFTSMGTNVKSRVKLQLDSVFSLPSNKTKPEPQSCPTQQLPRSPRLHWISQVHARLLVRNMSFARAYETGQRMGGELGHRTSKSSVPASRSGTTGTLSRQEILHKGSIFNAKLNENSTQRS